MKKKAENVGNYMVKTGSLGFMRRVLLPTLLDKTLTPIVKEREEMRNHTCKMKTGIRRTEEFERKGLASYGVNVGTRCGNNCTYCSSPALLRMHRSFQQAGESPFELGYSICDPTVVERVALDARRIRNRGTVQICTASDAWSEESHVHSLGRKCLQAILTEKDWCVRVLTKNAEVAKDFDLIQRHRDRVLVGLTLTATPDKDDTMHIIEPHASLNSERMAVMKEAHRRGLRTFGMLCPLLPGIADSPDQIDALVKFVVDCGAEEIFSEAVNSRANCLKLTQETLASAGYIQEAAGIEAIRHEADWSAYTTRLIANLQWSVRRHFDIRKLRILLYPGNLQPNDLKTIKKDDAGVVWL